MKLLTKDIKAYREAALEAQGGACALCGLPIPQGKAALDHDHRKGHVRAVLHLSCNSVEGKLINSLRMNGMTDEQLKGFLKNIHDYWFADYSMNPRHPREKTKLEREIKATKKLVTTSKRKETKDKYRLRLKELQLELKKENLDIWKP